MKAKKKKTDGGATQPRDRSGWSRFGRGLLMALDLLLAILLFVTAYAGVLSPLKYGGKWGIVGLAFAPMLYVVLFMLVLQLFWHRRGAVVLGISLIACAGPILTYCPLHFGSRHAAEGAATFRLTEYNVANLFDQRSGDYDSSYCAMMSYVLAQDADIVCLSEGMPFTPTAKNHMTALQYDSIHQQYPNIIVSGHGQVTLSKFPIEPIHLNMDPEIFSNGGMGAYRVTLPGGKLLTLFNVHMQSFRFTADDVDLYLSLTDMQREDFGDIRNQLLAKLAYANVCRARQAQAILQIIRHYGGPDVIICGDFNDIPDCYAIRAFEDAGFRDVYPEIGLGPMITFNANRFYFCIDHVMYRGALRPLSITKGTLTASDHYPLTVDFEVL